MNDKKNDIYINKRMSAVLKYLYPSPSSNDELLDKFEEICMLLDEAISEEDAKNTFEKFDKYIEENSNNNEAKLPTINANDLTIKMFDNFNVELLTSSTNLDAKSA